MDAPNKWEFGHPWEAVFLDGLSGKWLRLSNHGHAVASYEVAAWGSEQACIEAAWRHAYESRADLCADPALLAEAVEVLRAALRFIENTESELGIKLDSGDRARAFLAAQNGERA